jgi:CHRD domain/PEP-CTERM motif
MKLLTALALVLFCLVRIAQAHEEFFAADATNAAENPPAAPTTSTGAPRPASFGSAFFVLNDTQDSLTMTANVVNIDVTGTQTPDPNDNLTIAHIHGSASFSPTTNSPVIWGFFGSPFNDTNPNDSTMTPFTSGVGGTFTGKWDLSEGNNTTLALQLDNVLNGRTYINFHTTQFPGGEIRGTIVPVPEPTSIALVGIGIAAVLVIRTRRRLTPVGTEQ